MGKIVGVVAAHSDDEVLGCGGTIARHVAEGDSVHVIFMTHGVAARGGEVGAAKIRRMAAAERAGKMLGIASTDCFDFPDNNMGSVPLIEIVQILERHLARISPSIIYTHHSGDLNIDHRITHQAVMTACRPVPGSSVREIYAFEVMSSTEWNTPESSPFLPTHYVDISSFLSMKLKILDEVYGMEMRSPPHSRSIRHLEHLARHRGSCVGLDAAEAFMAIRQIR